MLFAHPRGPPAPACEIERREALEVAPSPTEFRHVSLLKSEPAGAITSMEELFALAHAMEHEAATRYTEIARRLRREGNPPLADVFDRLAGDERGHLDSVVRWSEKDQGHAPDPELVRWKMPDTFDDEGIATGDPHIVSAYRSLSMAVRNEERAFAFWSYVVAHAASPDIRRAAEAMAREELEHVATLRRERRRAYHAERAAVRSEVSARDLAALERRLAEQLEARAGRSDEARAARLRQLAGEARRNAEEVTGRAGSVALRLRLPRDLPDDPVGLSELLVDGYLEAAEHVRDEGSLAETQALAERAIRRLAWLREDLPELG
jgi:rubrerythrin